MTVGFVTQQSGHLLMHLAKSTIAVSHGARMMYALSAKPDYRLVNDGNQGGEKWGAGRQNPHPVGFGGGESGIHY